MKLLGKPLGDFPVDDVPHTIAYALMYRLRLDSFNELPKDKRPPRNLWDKPYRLSEFFDKLFKTDKDTDDEERSFIEFDPEEVD